MVNINGKFYSGKDAKLSIDNRGFNYGDALFETIKVVDSNVLFWEDHYFRLMASMRILRMEIPMKFTMEFLEDQILHTIKHANLTNNATRVKLTVYRNSEGYYLPETNEIEFIIRTTKLVSDLYVLQEGNYLVDLYKDHYVLSGLLSTLKTTNRILNITGSIYAKENEFQNCLLLNEKKHIVEALNGNVFLVLNNIIKTPSLDSGCIKGVMRKQVIEIINSLPEHELIEDEISPFELQKADEIFITNVISGIIAIRKYRKKTYSDATAKTIIRKLNMKLRLG